MSVSYTAVLPVAEETVLFVSGLLNEPFPVAGNPQVRSDTPTAGR